MNLQAIRTFLTMWHRIEENDIFEKQKDTPGWKLAAYEARMAHYTMLIVADRYGMTVEELEEQLTEYEINEITSYGGTTTKRRNNPHL
jgi:hypothetical protein